MKIELRKISFNERMSDETNCFIADLYINGVKVGSCENEGHGGCTNYGSPTPEGRKLIKEAEAHFNSLPMVKPNGYNFMLQPTLEGAIDEQLEDFLKAKEQKKMEKHMVCGILFGRPNGGSYTMIKYKVPLSQVDKGRLQQKVMEIKVNECKNGIQILNTNLEALGIQI